MSETGTIRYPWAEPPANGDVIEVARGIYWLRLPLPMALDHVNVYILDDGEGWTVVDTGFDSRKTRAIWEAVLAGPLAGKAVHRVIGTHHHPDHIGLAGWFQKAGAELAMPRTAWLTARMLQLDEQPSYSAESIEFYRRAGMDDLQIEKRKSERPFNFADCVHPMAQGFTRLQEGGTIEMGGRTWDIRMGDGHAPEHATFWSQNDSLVIGGDQLLPSISPNIGVYPTEPDADPLDEWLQSCTRLMPFARDDQLVLGGHKVPFYGLPKRLEQLIENHHGALDRLVEHLCAPRRASDCFAQLFKRSIGEEVYGLALVESLAHLNHLHQTGRASRTLRDGAYWFEAV